MFRSLPLRLIVVAVILTTLVAAASPQSNRVKELENKLNAASDQVGVALREMSTLQDQIDASYAESAATGVQIAKTSKQAGELRFRMQERARNAYRQGTLGVIDELFSARTLQEARAILRGVGDSFEQDAAAVKALEDSAVTLASTRDSARQNATLLVSRQADLERQRESILSAIESQQKLLASAKAELAALEAARRAAPKPSAAKVSPAVEAKRTARQQVLDQKLAALLAWIDPQRVRGSGVVTTGLSSWYGPGFDGRRASSGATYRQDQLTAATLNHPFGTVLKVSFRDRSVLVVVTDRGPYIHGRILDLSAGAAQALGLTGVQSVQIEIMLLAEGAPPFL